MLNLFRKKKIFKVHKYNGYSIQITDIRYQYIFTLYNIFVLCSYRLRFFLLQAIGYISKCN